MPRLAARGGGHTVFTDHRIARRPDSAGEVVRAEDLAAWREPEPRLRQRNLALALVAAGLQNGSAQEVIRGYRMLNHVEKDYPDDPDVLTTLGGVLIRGKQPAEALRRFERALALRPTYAPYEVNIATALIAIGFNAEAQRHLERALELDPLLQEAVELLCSIYEDRNERAKAAEFIAQYQRRMGTTPAQ